MNKQKIALAGGLLLAAGSSFAAIDTSAITDSISEAAVAIGVCGAAYLAMTVGGKVWKWIARVL
jgi:hypothetical protein